MDVLQTQMENALLIQKQKPDRFTSSEIKSAVGKYIELIKDFNQNVNKSLYMPQIEAKLKETKQDFLNGNVPDSCILCYTREKQGTKSTRQAIFSGLYTFDEVIKKSRLYEHDRSKLDLTPSHIIKRLEIRFSNQCNFKCRMCNAGDSNQIARELIEKCGLKGKKLGGAQISEKHANFIVNPKGLGSAADIEWLIHTARNTVREKTGVALQPEVRLLGEVRTCVL